mgnify:CR=1 FL=1
MTPVALTIAGSDPSGGAGLQADLKTFHQHRVYGMSVVTLLTVQNTQSVRAVQVLDPAVVLAQLDAVLSDIPPQAAKAGALGNAGVVRAIAERLAGCPFPLVVDPVMISKHGARLIDEQAVAALQERLLPCAALVTPNLQEAEVLCGIAVRDLAAMEKAAHLIARQGARGVLIKGGHLEGKAVDLLWANGALYHLVAPRLDTRHTHGTGCVYSAAITALLARGEDLLSSVQRAKQFVTRAMETPPRLGGGFGPTNMFAKTACRKDPGGRE